MDKLKQRMKIPLTDGDIRRILGKDTKIIKYGDLDEYDSIDDLLGDANHVVILIETEINSGHWVALLRYPNSNFVEWFDSYNLYPDDELNYVNLKMRKTLDELKPELSYLLDECPYTVIYNNTDLQEWAPQVNTCGRHVCLRILNGHKTLPQYINYIKSFGMSPDLVVCKMIN